MKQKIYVVLLSVLTVLAVALSGCATPTPTAAPTAAPTATAATISVPSVTAALTINGSVAHPAAYTLAELKAMPQNPVNESAMTGKGMMNVNGTGVSINALLEKASPATDAKNITFTGSDGYTKTVPLVNVTGITNATIVIKPDESLINVVSGLRGNEWVKNLTVITIS